MKLLELLEAQLRNPVTFCNHPRPSLLDKALQPASLGEQPQGGYKLWNGFVDRVLAHKQLESKGDGGGDKFTPPPAAPRGGHVVVEEAGIHCLLYMYWAKAIEEMSQELVRRGVATHACDFAWSEELVKDGFMLLGWPDHVVHAGGRAKVIIEAKTRKELITGTDLVSSNDPKVQVTLQQMYSYLRLNAYYGFAGVYGIITTFESSWFCKLEGDSLLVSEPVQASSNMYAALWYFLHLALSDGDQPHSGLAPALSLAAGKDVAAAFVKRVCGVAGVFKGNIVERLESYDLRSIEFHSCIGRFRSSSVFRASVEKEPLVLKIVDVSQMPQMMLEYLDEFEAYSRLSAIQGDSIPELVCWGFLSGALFFLGLSDAGDDLEMIASREGGEVPLYIAVDAIESLKEIHKSRTSHRDIRLSNACFEMKDDLLRVRWINLRRASYTGKEGEELNELERLLNVTPTQEEVLDQPAG